MDQESELDLVRRSKNGDAKAFRVLVEFYQGLVYSIAFRFTHDELESEDITQETFIKLWKNISRYREEFRLKSWLAKIVTNLCLDYYKSGRRKNKPGDLKEAMGSVEQHEDKLETEELRLIVVQLAERLTEKQKAVFILRDLERIEVDEVCRILDMTEGNLKSNLYYARLKIKEGLQKYYKT